MSRARRLGIAAAVGVVAAVGARTGGRHAVAEVERRFCRTRLVPPYAASARAREVHERLAVVDLHADSLLWGRDLLVRGDRGHVDVPRLIEGNVALQVLAASTRFPHRPNLDHNADTTDDVLLVAIGSGWPPGTWRSPLARARHLAGRAEAFAARSAGRFTVIRTRADLTAHLAARTPSWPVTAGLLAIEGAAPLEGDVANVEVLADAGYRMLSPAHFTDTAFGGSAHGVGKGGLTAMGREMVERMAGLGMVVDVAHASTATIDDILAITRRPVVASHTGLRRVVDNARNLTDAQATAIADTGGLIGIGFWPTACGGDDVADICRSILAAIDVAGIEHVALGSDFDGAVTVPFDASGHVLLTEGLVEAGMAADDVARVMGGNALRVLGETLPA